MEENTEKIVEYLMEVTGNPFGVSGTYVIHGNVDSIEKLKELLIWLYPHEEIFVRREERDERYQGELMKYYVERGYDDYESIVVYWDKKKTVATVRQRGLNIIAVEDNVFYYKIQRDKECCFHGM